MAKTIQINGRFLTQPITGVQRYAIEFCRALDSLIAARSSSVEGFRFEILTPPGTDATALHARHLTIRPVGHRQGHAWEQWDLPSHATGDLLFCPGNTAPVRCLLRGPRTVVTVHDLSYAYFPKAYSRSFRLLYHTLIPLVFKYASAVLTVSESERRSILEHFPQAADKLTAVQNGAISSDFGATLPRWIGQPAEPFVLYVGSHSRRKNLQGVLKAAAIVNRTRRTPFVVVGASAKTFASRRFRVPEELADRVTFLGQINATDELMRLYASATCLIFPSFYESSGLPPTEAMACGCPVIVSAIPALIERCGEAAVYCDPALPEDIADAVSRVVEDRQLREELIRKGETRVRQFTWDACVRQTLAVFGSTLGLKSSSRRQAA